jgi:hypothetical protein
MRRYLIMAKNIQEGETKIDKEIVTELIELTPEWWNSVILEVVYTCDGDNDNYDHCISSPGGNKEIIEPSGKIFDATYRLGKLFREHGKHWKKVTYKTWIQKDGTWSYKVNFEY